MLTFAWPSQGQAMAEKVSTLESFKPTGVRVGINAISMAKTFFIKDFKGWEVNADMDFRNYYLTVERGYWSRNVELVNGGYTNAGNYWRVGVDANILKKDPDKNMFFFGFKIGYSRYNEQLDYTVTTPEFGSVIKTLENKNLKSSWMEITTGLKVKIYKAFWMGYTARIKLLPGIHKEQQLQTYDIPGYGLTFKKPWWGFDYYLMIRLPLKRQK